MKINTRKAPAAFTLIELMAVITIIVILAGLVIGGMGFVNSRQATEKAKVQIALLSKALEEYKLENGNYPPTGNSSSGLNNSRLLFNALYYDGVQNQTTIYLPQLDPETNKQGWTSGKASSNVKILDPWGKEYGYRTGQNASGKLNSQTQNPDFDLWSYGKDGKTRTVQPQHQTNKDDIKNF